MYLRFTALTVCIITTGGCVDMSSTAHTAIPVTVASSKTSIMTSKPIRTAPVASTNDDKADTTPLIIFPKTQTRFDDYQAMKHICRIQLPDGKVRIVEIWPDSTEYSMTWYKDADCRIGRNGAAMNLPGYVHALVHCEDDEFCL